jgi:glycine/D-amino acid oxidase-like deaminating enzyme
MTKTDTPDVIVVGAGAAGVCCAAELVLSGLRPLLISEAADVGFQFRPMPMKQARPLRQALGRSLYGDGGWWYSLVKRLDVPIKLHRQHLRIGSAKVGAAEIKGVPSQMSAGELAGLLAARAPASLGTAEVETMRRVLHMTLTMPRQDLAALQGITVAEWVQKVGGNQEVTDICVAFAASSSYLSPEQVERYLSVFGFFSRLRDFYFGEAELCAVEPDLQTGLFVPLAAAIEQHGGIVRRGHRVAGLHREGDRIVGVVMDDGAEFRAPVIALAAGTSRLPGLFDGPAPHEVRAVRDFEAEVGSYKEFMTMYVVDRKLFPKDWDAVTVSSEAGTRLQFDFSATALAPWGNRPDWEVIGSERLCSAAQVEQEGGSDGLFDRMRETTEALIPGLAEATVERVARSHPSFLTPGLVGPKLPRQSPSLGGLWYVGEGSVPVDSVYGEGAASAGVLGARAITASLRG